MPFAVGERMLKRLRAVARRTLSLSLSPPTPLDYTYPLAIRPVSLKSYRGRRAVRNASRVILTLFLNCLREDPRGIRASLRGCRFARNRFRTLARARNTF